MTPDEARKAVQAAYPSPLLALEWIEHDIRHEEWPGIHTYSLCPCRRGSTRRGRCAECLREMLAVLAADEPKE